MKHFLIVTAMAILTTSLQLDNLAAQTQTTEQIIQQLIPPTKTRSMTPRRGVTVEGGRVEEPNSSINLYINFEFNSAELKQDGLITLDRLGAALKDERLARLDFLIGGHTDAVGSDRFNDKLSGQGHLRSSNTLLSGTLLSAIGLWKKVLARVGCWIRNTPSMGQIVVFKSSLW